jgi:DNA-binding transcriptional regulator YiaG
VREEWFLATRKRDQRRLPSPSRRRAIRVRAGASLEEVGELVGVSGEAVRLWETGQRIPSEAHRGDYLDVLVDLRAR